MKFPGSMFLILLPFVVCVTGVTGQEDQIITASPSAQQSQSLTLATPGAVLVATTDSVIVNTQTPIVAATQPHVVATTQTTAVDVPQKPAATDSKPPIVTIPEADFLEQGSEAEAPSKPKAEPNAQSSEIGQYNQYNVPYPIKRSRKRVSKAPSLQKTGSKLEAVCKRGNGYYAVDNDCDSYIICENGKVIKVSCPDGLHFNPDAQPNEYPCAYPSEVQCSVGTETKKPKSSNQCPRQYGFFAMNDGDCSKYVICQAGTATIMPCPAGLVFNPTIGNCDYVENVPQCNTKVFKDYICPDAPMDDDDFDSDIIYKYKYGTQCKLYIACQRGFPRLLSCERGLAFDEDSQSCIDQNYVEDCAPYVAMYID